jgi:hypothetical protein
MGGGVQGFSRRGRRSYKEAFMHTSLGRINQCHHFFKAKSEQTGPLCWVHSIWWDASGAVKAVT